MPTKTNSTVLKRGMSVTEFVVVTPIVLMLWMALMRVNEEIEMQMAQTLATRNLAKVLKPNQIPRGAEASTLIMVDRVDNAQASSRKVDAVKAFGMLDSFVFARNDKETKFTEALLGNHKGFRYNLALRFRDRSADRDSELRSRLLGNPKAIKGTAEALGTVERLAALTISSVLDTLKASGSGIPLLIDDTQSTLETQVDIRVPARFGAWDLALEQLSSIARSSGSVQQNPGERYTASSVHYMETEAGYHDSRYHWAPVLGMTISFVAKEAKHWNSCLRGGRDFVAGAQGSAGSWSSSTGGECERSKNFLIPPQRQFLKGNYSINCPWHMFVGDHCEYSLDSNSYHTLLFVLAKVIGVIKTVAAVVSLSYSEAANESVKTLSMEIKTNLLDKLEGEIKTRLEAQARNAAGKAVDQRLDAFLKQIGSNIQNVMRDSQSSIDKIEQEARSQRVSNPFVEGIVND